MMNRGTSKDLAGEVARVIVMAVILAFVYNSFSIKGIPFIRKVIRNVAVSDSELFSRPQNGGVDSGGSRTGKPDTKVIAPLHDRALASADSSAHSPDTNSTSKNREEVYRIISLAQLNRILEAGHVLLIDARDTAAYRKGRIKGARNIFGLDADQHFAELAPLARDTLVVIYCNNPDCHLGRMLAEFMGAIGFKRLYVYDEGWDGWEKAKMPIDSTVPMGL